MTILPELIHKFNAAPVKIPAAFFFTVIDKLVRRSVNGNEYMTRCSILVQYMTRCSISIKIFKSKSNKIVLHTHWDDYTQRDRQ